MEWIPISRRTTSRGTHEHSTLELPPEHEIGLHWLVRLRWGSVAGQFVALVVGTAALGLELPVVVLLALISMTVVTNFVLSSLTERTLPTWTIPSILVLDIALLTSMLAFSGGASNPFSAFLLVYVALASIMLRAQLAWSLVLLTIVSFGSLFFLPESSANHAAHGHHGHHGETSAFSMHLVGMWIAYSMAATFMTYFVGRISTSIRERDIRLSNMKDIALQNEKLATLSSFSANAAHELATPLGTIALIAGDLSKAIDDQEDPKSLHDDIELVSQEIARCRTILSSLAIRSGESIGETPICVSIQLIIDEVSALLAPHRRNEFQIRFVSGSMNDELVAPPKTLAQMLHNILRNAFDAQDEIDVIDPVEIQIDVADTVTFMILDRGCGMSNDTKYRLGEPFVSSKPDEKGLGLGLYLARAYVERVGGSLAISARDGGGTQVRFSVLSNPLDI